MAVAPSDRVSIEDGVVVGEGGGRELRADVFTPPPGRANGAGVLLIHGGAWNHGDRAQLRGYGILLGRIGYACVTCEYRLAPDHRWPAQLHDAKAALRWMRANAAALGFDPGKLAVSGNSAGGHLSLMLAGTQDRPEFEGDGGNAGVSTAVAAAIAFYAPVLLGRPGALNERVAKLLGADATDEAIAAASPVTYVTKDMPPVLLIHGNQDELVPDKGSIIMYEALRAAGARAELHIYDGVPHAFDASPAFGRQAAAIMDLFLDRTVVNPRGFAVASGQS
jgi:acetyl esterase/lipase